MPDHNICACGAALTPGLVCCYRTKPSKPKLVRLPKADRPAWCVSHTWHVKGPVHNVAHGRDNYAFARCTTLCR